MKVLPKGAEGSGRGEGEDVCVMVSFVGSRRESGGGEEGEGGEDGEGFGRDPMVVMGLEVVEDVWAGG